MLQAMLDESVMQYDVIESDDVAEIDRVAEITTVEIDYVVTDVHTHEFDFDEWSVRGVRHHCDRDCADIHRAVVESPTLAEDVETSTDDAEFVVVWPSRSQRCDGDRPRCVTMDEARRQPNVGLG